MLVVMLGVGCWGSVRTEHCMASAGAELDQNNRLVSIRNIELNELY